MTRIIKPNIPPDSCDHIDRIGDLAENMSTESDADITQGYNEIIKQELELVRTINTQLRRASKFWYDKYNKKRGA